MHLLVEEIFALLLIHRHLRLLLNLVTQVLYRLHILDVAYKGQHTLVEGCHLQKLLLEGDIHIDM